MKNVVIHCERQFLWVMDSEKTSLLRHEEEPVVTNKVSCHCLDARHVLAIWAFFGFISLFTLRVNLSVALVAMVNESHSLSHVNMSYGCFSGNPNATNTSSSSTLKDGEFDWDENMQGIILGAFFYGYCVTQLPGGWLAEVIGGKRLFGLGIFFTSVLSLLTPIAARTHVYLLVMVRVVEGIAQGVTYPSMHSVWGKWAPAKERSTLVSFSYAGANIGIVIALLVTGYLSEYGFAGGWPSTFYVFGGLGCLWFVGWMLMTHDTPASHPRISQEEREYIEKSIGKKQLKVRPPWLKILKCRGLWAILAAHIANDWGIFTTITCLPQYMREVLGFDIKDNGILSSLPYLLLWLCNTISGPIADFLRKKYLSTKNTRKLINSIGLLIPSGLMIGMAYSGCNTALAVTLVCLAVGFSGFTLAGYSVNHLDIAPRYAGIMYGLTNTFGTMTGFIGPEVVGALTYHNETVGQWRIFYLITAGVFGFGGIVYLLFAEGEAKSWAVDPAQNQVLKIQEEGNGE